MNMYVIRCMREQIILMENFILLESIMKNKLFRGPTVMDYGSENRLGFAFFKDKRGAGRVKPQMSIVSVAPREGGCWIRKRKSATSGHNETTSS